MSVTIILFCWAHQFHNNRFSNTPLNTRFHLINVSDNANYGDLLFPLILKETITHRLPSTHVAGFAPVASDWSRLGALPTLGYQDFVRSSKPTAGLTVVVGGGGLLNTRWNQLRWRLPPAKTPISRRIIKKFAPRTDFSRHDFCPVSCISPFIISHRDFSGARIFYNSVGAFPTDTNPLDPVEIAHLKENHELLTVRDNSVVESLENLGIRARLVPDSALIMSDVFGPDRLKAQIRPEIADQADTNYIVLQLGTEFLPSNFESFAENLRSAAIRNGYRIVLSPIKYRIPNRTGDAEILQRLAAKGDPFEYVEPENLFETMFLISHSQGYLGTSLHGFITAYSFRVPAFGFGLVGKLKAYIESWTSGAFHLLDYTCASEVFERIIHYPHAEMSERLVDQKLMVRQNLEKGLFGEA